jgi:hypothetical protein
MAVLLWYIPLRMNGNGKMDGVNTVLPVSERIDRKTISFVTNEARFPAKIQSGTEETRERLPQKHI